MTRLLAGQALVIIGRRAAFHIDNVLALIGRARDLGALDGLRAAVIQALDALFPSRPMQHVQVPFINIAWNKDVEALALADIGRAICGKLNHPALIQFKGGLVDRLLQLCQTLKMLDRPFILKD